MKYFGFGDLDDVKSNFFQSHWDNNKSDYVPTPPPDNFPTDDEIRIAIYEGADYEGAAIIIYEKDGKLYEVHGSHCSCYGLEGQWSPEETSWAAINLRPRPTQDGDSDYTGDYKDYVKTPNSTYSYSDASREAYWKLVDEHVKED